MKLRKIYISAIIIFLFYSLLFIIFCYKNFGQTLNLIKRVKKNKISMENYEKGLPEYQKKLADLNKDKKKLGMLDFQSIQSENILYQIIQFSDLISSNNLKEEFIKLKNDGQDFQEDSDGVGFYRFQISCFGSIEDIVNFIKNIKDREVFTEINDFEINKFPDSNNLKVEVVVYHGVR